MAKFYQTKEFLDQQPIWEKKLADSGFIDVEQRRIGARKPDKDHTSKVEYFQTITRRVHDEEIIKPLDLTVMTMRGDGFSIKQIAKECDLHRQTIRFIIRRYEHAWGIRYWSLSQRYLRHERG